MLLTEHFCATSIPRVDVPHCFSGDRRVPDEAAAGVVGNALGVDGGAFPARMDPAGAPDASEVDGLLRHVAKR